MKNKIAIVSMIVGYLLLPQQLFARDVWIGTAPICKGKASDCRKRGMDYIRSDKRGNGKKCWSGVKVLCRSRPSVKQQPVGKNKKLRYVWIGTAPFCGGKKSDCRNKGMRFVRYSNKGDGKKCVTGRKVQCVGPARSGIWIGTSPACAGHPRDCARRGMRFVRYSKKGDGKRCITGKKVYCSGKFKRRNPPYYVIAHMTNTPNTVDFAVKKGANAVEMDLSFKKNGNLSRFYHGPACDCYPVVTTAKGVCGPLYRDGTRQGHRGPGRACKAKSTPSHLLSHVATKQSIALVIIDSKIESGLRLANAGRQVILNLEHHLFGRGYKGQVIVGIAKAKHIAYLRAAVKQARRSRYRQRIFFGIDQETSVSSTINKLRQLGTKNIVFGTGISAVSPGKYYDEIVRAAQQEQDRRTGFTYIWTLDKASSMKKYINLGARGIMTNNPARASRVFRQLRLQKGTFRNGLKPAR